MQTHRRAALACWPLVLSVLLSVSVPLAAEPSVAGPEGTPALDSPLLDELGLAEVAGHPAGRRALGVLSEEHLIDLQRGLKLDDLVSATGEPLRNVVAAALGDFDSDLIYQPLTPCRLVDTRLAGGAFASGATRHYNLIGPTSYSTYGGSSSDCGIPGVLNLGGATSYNLTRALVLNVTAVSPTGNGHLRAWATNKSMPTASILNFTAGVNIANGLVLETCSTQCTDFTVPLTCGDPCPSGDLSIFALTATHVVVDVMGVMVGADDSSVSQDVSRHFSAIGGALDGIECTAIQSCTVNNSSDSAVEVLVLGSVHLQDEDQEQLFAVATLGTAETPCEGGTTSVAYGVARYHGPWAPDDFTESQATLTPHAVFTVPANSGRTFYLKLEGGQEGGGDRYLAPTLHCVVLP